GHKGAVIWVTGLSASGKSTIAHLNSFRMSVSNWGQQSS
ncbi:MAG: adenylyl-sulfate kinase, partial [Candidatus Heimdallarchaeota archaeon]|nr:adenylyl-sulfate kinase [Candidatus Heimdallarchaeota archaeon]